MLLALPAMIVFALAQGGHLALMPVIFDQTLPNGEQVGLVCFGIVGLYIAKGVGSYFSAYFMADAGQRLVRDLRTELFSHVLGQSTAFFGERATGRLLSRLTNDVARVQQVVSETCGDLLRESLLLIVFAGMLLRYDWWLALMCMISAPLVVYPLVRLGQRVRRTTRRSQEQLEHVSHLTVEAFTGHRIVQAFQAEAFERRKFLRAAERLYRTNMKVMSTLFVLPPLMEVLGGLSIAAVILYGVRQIGSGELSPGQFIRLRWGVAADVSAGEETEPGERQHPASDRRRRAYLRDAGHAHRGWGSPRCSGPWRHSPRGSSSAMSPSSITTTSTRSSGASLSRCGLGSWQRWWG